MQEKRVNEECVSPLDLSSTAVSIYIYIYTHLFDWFLILALVFVEYAWTNR